MPKISEEEIKVKRLVNIWLKTGACNFVGYESFVNNNKEKLESYMIQENEIREEIRDCKQEMKCLNGNSDKERYQELKKTIKYLEKQLKKDHKKHEREDDDCDN